eukprot:SAG11_NODE_1624_length_4555_cov_3.452424_9_plen_252_part_00
MSFAACPSRMPLRPRCCAIVMVLLGYLILLGYQLGDTKRSFPCTGTAAKGRFEHQSCATAYMTIQNEQDKSAADSWCANSMHGHGCIFDLRALKLAKSWPTTKHSGQPSPPPKLAKSEYSTVLPELAGSVAVIATTQADHSDVTDEKLSIQRAVLSLHLAQMPLIVFTKAAEWGRVASQLGAASSSDYTEVNGLPLLRDILAGAQAESKNQNNSLPYHGYINGDIVLAPDAVRFYCLWHCSSPPLQICHKS